MDWMNQLGSLLQNYAGGQSKQGNVDQDFDHVSQHAPSQEVAQGLSEAFRSNQTPPMADMVANLFRNSNDTQRAGLLNQLISAAGPGLLSGMLSGGALSGLGGLLGGGGQVTPQQASQVSPEQVREIAEKAEQHNPTVVDQLSNFYAQHPTLVRTLGEAALTIAMAKIAQRQYSKG